MIKRSTKRALLFSLLLLFGGCARTPSIERTALSPASYSELRDYLLSHKPDLALFRSTGPFSVARQDDLELRLSERLIIDADLFLSSHAEKAPLVIFLHGHDATKDEHAYQAMHTASWGLHSLTLQMPNTGPWVKNGHMLASVVNFIHQRPDIFNDRIDVSRMILVGHSFGAAAVAIALAEQAPVTGGILLDPAGIGRNLPAYLRRIRKPVLVLGADERVAQARYRDYFFRFIGGDIAEVSIADATHEDAQFPADDDGATQALQITFAGAITAAAFSLAVSHRFDYAWASFQADLKNGALLKAKKK